MIGERDESWLTLPAAAARINRQLRTINTWVDNGLPTVPMNGQQYVKAWQLTDWAIRHGRLRRHPSDTQRKSSH